MKHLHFTSLSSTNQYLKDHYSELDHLTLISTTHQTQGRGRYARFWSDYSSMALVSLLVKRYTIKQSLLPFVAATAIHQILEAITPGFLIKWPNDIFIGDKKIAGLLLELTAEADTVHYALLGIGIDANISLTDLSPPLKDILTSLQAEVGHPVDRVALLARVLWEFELRYQQLEEGEYDSIIREWKSLSLTLDRRVAIKTINKTFVGEAIDIDEHGALIIRKDNGKVERVIAGDCFQL